MIKLLLAGLWVCIVTLLSSYAAVSWASLQDQPKKKEEPFLEGLEYRRTPNITIPMIAGGGIEGYVTARFVFTADAATLRRLPIDPTAFVTSAAFQQVYVNGQIKMNQLQKYNLQEIADAIKHDVNGHLNGEVVQDVLIDGLNYIAKSDIRPPSAHPAVRATQAQPVNAGPAQPVAAESHAESPE